MEMWDHMSQLRASAISAQFRRETGVIRPSCADPFEGPSFDSLPDIQSDQRLSEDTIHFRCANGDWREGFLPG